MLKRLIIIAVLIGLSGCSSVLSVENPSKGASHGLGYFMPKKDFLVTVIVASPPLMPSVPTGSYTASSTSPDAISSGSSEASMSPRSSKPSVKTVFLGTTTAYPDLSKNYVLKHGTNAFGRSALNIRINEKGLLVSAQSEMKSGISDIVSNNKTPKSKGGLNHQVTTSNDKSCSTEGAHTFIYKSTGTYDACGITITITKYGDNATINAHGIKENEAVSGIFYRQNQPYLMTAVGKGIESANIVLSPSESKVRFLPIARTFFADNKTDFRFRDGVPSKYQQGTDGEIVALFKLPADIIAAYARAAGKVFDSFGKDAFEYELADPVQTKTSDYINPRRQ